jgi:hypothetical protein
VERWKDAECLFRAGRYAGAIYLCGYSLECWLKFHICEARGTSQMEVSEAKQLGHELPVLLGKTGLAKKLREARELRDLLLAFQKISNRWSTELRYSGSASDNVECKRFLQDTEALLSWLRTQLRR